jgi:hypothetical protein
MRNYIEKNKIQDDEYIQNQETIEMKFIEIKNSIK